MFTFLSPKPSLGLLNQPSRAANGSWLCARGGISCQTVSQLFTSCANGSESAIVLSMNPSKKRSGLIIEPIAFAAPPWGTAMKNRPPPARHCSGSNLPPSSRIMRSAALTTSPPVECDAIQIGPCGVVQRDSRLSASSAAALSTPSRQSYGNGSNSPITPSSTMCRNSSSAIP